MDRVHLEFLGKASGYIPTHYGYAIALLFIPYKFLVRMMVKFRITKEKENRRTLESGRNKTFKFFFFPSRKGYVERTDVTFLYSFLFKNMLIKMDSTVP